ncbi:hypothetical protein D3C81_1934330 [compost metagenome]
MPLAPLADREIAPVVVNCSPVVELLTVCPTGINVLVSPATRIEAVVKVCSLRVRPAYATRLSRAIPVAEFGSKAA